MAFYELEPFGDERADLRAGIIASTIAQVGSHGKGSFTPKDFMPQFEKKRQSVEDMQQLLMTVSRQAAAVSQAKEKRAAALKRRVK